MSFGTPFGFTPGGQPVEEKPVRARTKSGKFQADDPETPDVNEAWVEPPKPKRTRKAKE